MAHNLTIRANGKAEMAFVGEAPWHGLGQSVTQGASIETWATEAGLDWQAEESPVIYMTPVGQIASKEKKVIWRSDTRGLLGVVGDGYQVVQPGAVLEFFRDLTEESGWHIHTAGSLGEGRRVWAMATRNDMTAQVGPQDEVRGNLLLATSLDGTLATSCGFTSVRVVCANTLAVALGEKGFIRINHRSTFDSKSVKTKLGLLGDTFETFMGQCRELSGMTCQYAEARDLLMKIFRTAPVKVEAKVDPFAKFLLAAGIEPEQKEPRAVGKVLELFAGAGMGSRLEGAVGTRWGLLNSVTEWVDHHAGRAADTRLSSAWFGPGQELKTKAFDVLLTA